MKAERYTGPEIPSRMPQVRLVLIAVFLIAAGVFVRLGGPQDYVRLYRRELDAVLGEGRWQCVRSESIERIQRFSDFQASPES